MGKDVEGSGRGVIELLPWNLPVLCLGSLMGMTFILLGGELVSSLLEINYKLCKIE
jgi:hypothetical protein